MNNLLLLKHPVLSSCLLRTLSKGCLFLVLLIVTDTAAAQTTWPRSATGSYTALLDRHPWYNGGFGGLLKLTVTPTGSYSGRITRGRHQASFRGQLSLQNDGLTPISSFFVPRRKPYEPLEVVFTLQEGGASLMGTLKEPGGATIQLKGYQHGFSSSQPAASFVGAWNVTYEFERPWDPFFGTLWRWPYGDLNYPQGASWFIQRVNSSGTVTWVGRMADGTTLTYSTALNQRGTSVVHVMLYGLYGSFQSRQDYNVINSTVTGNGDWFKAPVGKGRSYAQGIPRHSLSAIGGRYVPPAKGEQLFGIKPALGNGGIGIIDPVNGRSDGATFTLWKENRLIVAVPGSPENEMRLSMSLDTKTGIIQGKVASLGYNNLMPELARPGTFTGLISPHQSQGYSICRGHLLVPPDRSPTSPIHSLYLDMFLFND